MCIMLLIHAFNSHSQHLFVEPWQAIQPLSPRYSAEFFTRTVPTIPVVDGEIPSLAGALAQSGEAEPVSAHHIVRSFDPCVVSTVH